MHLESIIYKYNRRSLLCFQMTEIDKKDELLKILSVFDSTGQVV